MTVNDSGDWRWYIHARPPDMDGKIQQEAWPALESTEGGGQIEIYATRFPFEGRAGGQGNTGLGMCVDSRGCLFGIEIQSRRGRRPHGDLSLLSSVCGACLGTVVGFGSNCALISLKAQSSICALLIIAAPPHVAIQGQVPVFSIALLCLFLGKLLPRLHSHLCPLPSCSPRCATRSTP